MRGRGPCWLGALPRGLDWPIREPMRVGLVVVACVCLTVACGKAASTPGDEPALNGDPDPAAACAVPCRVVVSGLMRPTELRAGGGYVYFVERGIRDDTWDGVVTRVPAQGGAAQTLTAAPGILGLFMNRTSLFWTHLEPVAADYSYAIATVPNTGGTPADLLQLPYGLNPVGADDVAVYGATQHELLAISLADRTKRTLAQVWQIGTVAVTGATLTMTNRGHTMPPEGTLSDPGTAPCLVDSVAKVGGTLATLYTAPTALIGANCNPTTLEAFDGGVVWLGPGSNGTTTSIWKLGAGAAAPSELATGLPNDHGQLIANDTAAYFNYRTPDNDMVFVRCSKTGAVTTLWSAPILPFGMAVDETSLYISTSVRSDDGLRKHGAILALPAQR